jgi:hypothetical protein
VVLLNPALDSDKQFPERVEQISVFYSENDSATGFARWIPFSNWGDMGNEGYNGPEDSRVMSYNEEDLTGKKMGHSDFAKYPEVFGPMIELLCRD